MSDVSKNEKLEKHEIKPHNQQLKTETGWSLDSCEKLHHHERNWSEGQGQITDSMQLCLSIMASSSSLNPSSPLQSLLIYSQVSFGEAHTKTTFVF